VKPHLRKEKNCLNCGAEITGRFCSNCGQENIETKETIGHILRHFFEDITHFDSKFFTTLKYLLFRPGFLTMEYISGRRAAYLNPIRMYVFISAVYFLVSFFQNNHEENLKDDILYTHVLNKYRQHLADSLRQHANAIKLTTANDSTRIHTIRDIASSLDTVVTKKPQDESVTASIGEKGMKFKLQEDRYNSIQEYDSVQRTLPESEKNKGFLNWLIRTNIHLKEKYGSRRQVVVEENYQHSIPKLMFIMLPVFALFIYWLHSKKKYYYVQHVIFSIHFHSFTFFLFLIVALLKLILPVSISQDILSLVSWILAFVYLVIALRIVYKQSVGLSFIKSIAIALLYFITLIIGLALAALISFFTA